MEEMKSQGSLSIGESKKREAIPEGTYEAVYTGLRFGMLNTKKGPKKVAWLDFKLTGKSWKDKKTSYLGWLYQDNDGSWVVGGKSDLADVIKAITRGKNDLNASHINTPVFIDITNTKKIKDGEEVVYDAVSKIMAKPVSEDAPAQAITAAQQAPTQDVQQAPVAAKQPASNDDLLTSLTEMSDFKV